MVQRFFILRFAAVISSCCCCCCCCATFFDWHYLRVRIEDNQIFLELKLPTHICTYIVYMRK